jgi:hypothetical protein
MRMRILGSVPHTNGSGMWMRIFCNRCLSPFNTFIRKGKEPEPDPHSDPYLGLTEPDADPRDLKASGSGILSLSMCSGAAVPETAERGDEHGEGGGERGRGAHRVGATGKKDDQIGIDNL